MAVTFVTPLDFPRLARIQKLIEREIPVGPVPVELGPTPAPGEGASPPKRKHGQRHGHGRSPKSGAQGRNIPKKD
jgi:hypothetical protein